MLREMGIGGAFLALALGPAASSADVVCPDSSYATATLSTTRDRITITPSPYIFETFEQLGITIRVYLKNCAGEPLAGIPAEGIVITNPGLCVCPGGNFADASTDAGGSTTFSGRIRGGGCVESLDIVADGVRIATLAIRTNTYDHVPASPCYVDMSDFVALAAVLGRPDRYSICFDVNESGPPTINAGDMSSFAGHFATHCP